MYDKLELTLRKHSHKQEGANTIASRQPPKTQPRHQKNPYSLSHPRNPTLVLMLTQEISHQFGSIRFVWSARPPEVAEVHHNAIPIAPRQQETSGHPGLICCAEILENQGVSPLLTPFALELSTHLGENNISDSICYFVCLFGFFL